MLVRALFFPDNGEIRSFDNSHGIFFRREENKLELREYGDLIFSPGATSGVETAKVVMKSNGNVGIGIDDPVNKLHVNGDIFGLVIGGIQKLFRIPHPQKAGMDLVHASVEGPENAVFYRGQAQLENGMAEIALPDYFEALTRQENRTAQLTCKNGWSPLYVDGEVVGGRFTVRTTETGNADQAFYWELKAVRSDIEPLETEVPTAF